MTDSASLVPNDMGIPTDLEYKLKASSVRCRSYRASIPSSNKSVFSPSDTIICYISGGRRNSYLDCANTYLRYTLKNNDTTATPLNINLDNNGASVINRLDVFHGSNNLESVQNYNMLMTHFLDFNYTPAQKAGLSAMYGTDPAGTRAGFQVLGANTNSLTICMPILSGTIGLGADKYLPVGRLADDIRLEFTLESQAVGVYSTAALTTGWTITSFEIEAAYIELSDEGEDMVRSVAPVSAPLYLHSTSYRSYTSTLPASQSAFSALVPARFASLKTLIVHPRPQTTSVSATSYSLSCRSNPQITSWWFRIGSALIPAKFVVQENANSTGGYGETYAEIVRSFHALSAGGNCAGIDATQFNVRDATALTGTPVKAMETTTNSFKNAYAIALEMEGFSNRSDLIICGMNTLSQQVYFEFNSAGSNVAQILTFFAIFDQILVLDQSGLLSARF